MEQIQDNLHDEQLQPGVITVDAKIYTLNQIRICTFLGGPLVAGYLVAENYKAFNDYKKAKDAWIIALVATVFVFGLIFLLPENIHIPNVVFPLVYSWLTYILANHYQGGQIKAHLANEGQTYNWSRAIVVSLIGMAVIVVMMFVGILISEMIWPSEV